MSEFASATVQEGTGDVLAVSHGDDRRFLVEFYSREVEDEKETRIHGRRILKTVTHCRKRAVGDTRTVWDAPVTELDKRRWPQLWQAFERGEKEMVVGTPLDAWPLLNVDQRVALKNWGFKTVEQVAEVTDASLADMGNETSRLIAHVRGNAQKFIAEQESGAAERRMMDQLNERDNEIGALKHQLAELSQAMERMQAQRLAEPVVQPQETGPGFQPIVPHVTPAPPPAAPVGLESLAELPEVEPVGDEPMHSGALSLETSYRMGDEPIEPPSPQSQARIGKTKLSEGDIAQIRLNPDNLSQAALAKKYGVSPATIRNYRK